ncbi:unnamed protein product [Rangifer tarandus platyrhynchus]|uniref:Uncharacterized protein n=1 Tax=Rangifer tarandus platyrhynchus TaxID=3082113 RepID=A0AC60A7S8_RANTA
MVRSMGSQRIRHDLATEQQQGCCWWFGCSPNQKSQTLSMGLCDELQHLGILEAFLTSMLTEAASPHDKILHILRDQVYPKLSEGSQNKGMMPHGGEGVLGPKLPKEHPGALFEFCFVLFFSF